MHTGRHGDRVLGGVRAASLLVLLGGLGWLTVALVFQGVDRAGHWVPVLSVGVAIVGTLVTLVTSWLQQRPVVGELGGAAGGAGRRGTACGGVGAMAPGS